MLSIASEEINCHLILKRLIYAISATQGKDVAGH